MKFFDFQLKFLLLFKLLGVGRSGLPFEANGRLQAESLLFALLSETKLILHHGNFLFPIFGFLLTSPGLGLELLL